MRSALAYLGRETGERHAFRRPRIGVLPPLADPVETGPRGLLLSAPRLGTTQPEQVTDRVAALQACAQHGFCLVELLGAEIGLEHGILKYFPLGVAATNAGELVEARLGEEWFHVSDRLAICPVRKGVNTLHQREGDLASQDIPRIRETLQSVDHVPHVDLITGNSKGQGGMGISEGWAGSRRRRGSQVAHFLRREWRCGATVHIHTPQEGSAIV